MAAAEAAAEQKELMAMMIGAESGAATGPIPAEARPQEGLRLERAGASPTEGIRLQTNQENYAHPA